MFYQIHPQFFTRRGHMQHVFSFPARLKHRPPVSSHLNEKKTLPSHGWTVQVYANRSTYQANINRSAFSPIQLRGLLKLLLMLLLGKLGVV